MPYRCPVPISFLPIHDEGEWPSLLTREFPNHTSMRKKIGKPQPVYLVLVAMCVFPTTSPPQKKSSSQIQCIRSVNIPADRETEPLGINQWKRWPRRGSDSLLSVLFVRKVSLLETMNESEWGETNEKGETGYVGRKVLRPQTGFNLEEF